MESGFYIAAIIGVLLAGIGKSGFTSGGGVVAVMLMSLFVSPQIAVGIMLPLLVVMDVLNLWRYRHDWQWKWVVRFLPGAVVGILVGWLLFTSLSAAGLRIAIGCLALFFVARRIFGVLRRTPSRPIGTVGGQFLGGLSGLGSFVAHAGGPPADAFLLSQRIHKTELVATNIYLFFVINGLKLIPYALLGLLSFSNLTTSLLLLPLVPIGVLLGHFLHNRVSQPLFESIAFTLLGLSGLKLLWDGISALL